MDANLVALLYLVAGVLFILALRGLSSPETSRQGNLFGMIGMAIAIVTTLAWHPPTSLGAWALVVAGFAHRRRHRRGDRAAGADDRDAASWSPPSTRWSAWRRCWWRRPRSMRRRPSASARPAASTAPAWSRCRSASPSAR